MTNLASITTVSTFFIAVQLAFADYIDFNGVHYYDIANIFSTYDPVAPSETPSLVPSMAPSMKPLKSKKKKHSTRRPSSTPVTVTPTQNSTQHTKIKRKKKMKKRNKTSSGSDLLDLEVAWWNWEFCNSASLNPEFTPPDKLVPNGYTFLAPLGRSCDSKRHPRVFEMSPFEQVFFPVWTYANVDFADDLRTCPDTRKANEKFWSQYLTNASNFVVAPYATKNGENLNLTWLSDGLLSGFYKACPNKKPYCDPCDKPSRQCHSAQGTDIGPVMGWWVHDDGELEAGKTVKYEFGAELRLPNSQVVTCNQVQYKITTCHQQGSTCESTVQCCSDSVCDQGICTCANERSPCNASSQCCGSLVCDPRRNECRACTPDGGPCQSSEDCCSGSGGSSISLCMDRTCQPCFGKAKKCQETSDCCGGFYCKNHQCQLCVGLNEICDELDACCMGDCKKGRCSL